MSRQPNNITKCFLVTSLVAWAVVLSGCRSLGAFDSAQKDNASVLNAVDLFRKHLAGVDRIRFAKFQLTANGSVFFGAECERYVAKCLTAALYGQSRFVYVAGQDGLSNSGAVEIAAWIDIDERFRFAPCGNKVEFGYRAVTALRDAVSAPDIIVDFQRVVDRDALTVSSDRLLARESVTAEIVRKLSESIDDALDERFPLSATADWKIDAQTLGICAGEGVGFRRGDKVVIVCVGNGDDARAVAVGKVDPGSGRGTVHVDRWIDDVARDAFNAIASCSRMSSDNRFVAIRIRS